MILQPGQRVRCIRTCEGECAGEAIKGHIYTVMNVNDLGITLEEIICGIGGCTNHSLFDPRNFKPLGGEDEEIKKLKKLIKAPKKKLEPVD
jgi:hypothetical protein